MVLSLKLAEAHGPVLKLFELNAVVWCDIAAFFDHFLVLRLVNVDQRRHLWVVAR